MGVMAEKGMARKTSRRVRSSPSKSRAGAQVSKERISFRQLLAANPNYFGNLAESTFKPVKKIASNTSHEELACVGYNPELKLLEATVQIKLPVGFKGDLCSAGSFEHVRFYLDYGAGWVDMGVAAFNAHDLPNTTDCAKRPDKPLAYVVTLPIEPKRQNCGDPLLPTVRAILSWDVVPPPNAPGWVPVWGNVLESHIQIKPRRWIIGELVDVLNLGLKKAVVPQVFEEAKDEPIPLPDPPPLSLGALAELYAVPRRGATKLKSAVEPHRFGFAHAQSVMSAAGLNQEVLSAAALEWKGLGLDWSNIIGLIEQTKADVGYEELECFGLDYNAERLVATFRIKRPTGYSGNLCQSGSTEYVAFWADWHDDCEWTYLGTAEVRVHDIDSIPAGGLTYSAVLPVDLTAFHRPCTKPKISRVRAVLSWAVPPSTTDPDDLTTWGNRLDAHVQLRPGEAVESAQPIISIVGGISLNDIDVFGNGLTKPGAKFALYATDADPWDSSRQCPFGGRIIVQGPTGGPFAGLKYRLRVRRSGQPVTEVSVTDPYYVTPSIGPSSWHYPDPGTDFFSYVGPTLNINQVLGYWTPIGDNPWELRLELADAGYSVVGSTPWYRVQLDNTGPQRRPILDPPTVDIWIDSGGDCMDFTPGSVTGGFVARDTYFGAFTLATTPASLGPPAPMPASGTTQTPHHPGTSWSLDTSSMTPCGYVVTVHVWDRAIVGSMPGSHHYNFADVGFCLRGTS